jgi:GntR family transcriptional regulator, transcriptional repressor for pyruvate dehydrogenase complex
MSLRAVQSRSLGDQVFQQLAGEIMGGRYAPGEGLPAERSLAEVFHVNRHVVREALKRLEQVGLVKISQGGSTRINDFKRHAGLDLLALMAEHASGGDEIASYLLSILEMRAVIAADVVRLCAIRGSRTVRDGLVAIAIEMKNAADDEEQLFALEVRFWELLHEGADNLAYRLGFNSLLKGVYAMGPFAHQWSIHEVKSSDYRGPLAAAIASGDAAKAEAMTRDAMRTPIEAFKKGLGQGALAPSGSAAPGPSPSTTRTASARPVSTRTPAPARKQTTAKPARGSTSSRAPSRGSRRPAH